MIDILYDLLKSKSLVPTMVTIGNRGHGMDTHTSGSDKDAVHKEVVWSLVQVWTDAGWTF